MTAAADRLFVDGAVYTFSGAFDEADPHPEPDAAAVAVRDGRIVRVGSTYDVAFLADVDTDVVDLDGRVLVPGFVDAHTHLTTVGRRLVNADLAGASDPADAVARLADRADGTADAAAAADPGDVDEWVLGFGYDESTWPAGDRRYLTRGDLDAVSTTRPVAAVREDMHVASLNGVALDRLADRMPAADVRRSGGEPTGVVVEAAVEALARAIEPDRERTRELVRAASDHAVARGVTGVHDMVRRSHAPAVYRAMARAGELPLRVRLNYWSDHLDALAEVGLGTNDGSAMVRTGAIKTFTDGSIGGRTAKLSAPYDDRPGDDGADGDADDPTGEWVVAPDDLRELVARADDLGFQVAAHAIGDVAIDEALDAFAAVDSDGARHRIEHAELASDAAIERMADLGVVASMQPNFHRWADVGGLYDARLGDRRTATNRLRTVREAGVRLAFGSDCMPLDPLSGIDHAVSAPTPAQSLPVGAALRAYTRGAAYAGFDEDRLGTVEPGTLADVVVLEASPWTADPIRDVDVAMTVVDGRVVYDGR
jgi:predicted amidohydrolase YtcJ